MLNQKPASWVVDYTSRPDPLVPPGWRRLLRENFDEILGTLVL